MGRCHLGYPGIDVTIIQDRKYMYSVIFDVHSDIPSEINEWDSNGVAPMATLAFSCQWSRRQSKFL
jgi:hypothetical protein